MLGAPPETEHRDDEPPWGVWAAPAAIGAGFAAGVIASSLVAVIGQPAGSSVSHPSPAVALIGDLLFDLCFVAAALYFAGLRTPLRASDFGFRRVSPVIAVVAVLAAGLGYYVLTAVYASLVHLHGSDKLPSELGAGKSTAALAAAGVFVCVIAPVLEEFFFRGFLFGALRRWRVVVAGRDLGTWLAAAVTGILFGLAHTGSASSQYLIPLGFLGFVLCLVRWKTKSLYPCIALHSTNNSLALGVNQLHWNAGEIVALIAGSLLVIGAATAPLAFRPAPEGIG
jgi:membrane protease YdiL (CAAX protease family)